VHGNDDEVAFREFYEQYHPAILAYLLRRLGRRRCCSPIPQQTESEPASGIGHGPRITAHMGG
jgi:hypothetical protein